MTAPSQEIIADGKYVELKYEVVDAKTGGVLTEVQFPLGYVHGVNEVLAPAVMRELEGRSAGEIIEVEIDCDALFGPRDESLVVIESLDNVPEAYRQVGMAILMESDSGRTRTFLVTRIQGDVIVLDGNNPLCGRQVVFRLRILTVREATPAEREFGGGADGAPDLPGSVRLPI
ncbi:MAG TPA: peptidylprolyl isomerase [Thiobacillaceae bacterium]|nr:peptidylprolyl isomerase [Thiobacillaceae bacterium]HNU63868.1 peptidylprolyl isomerase [Thiobacillaceae bacterium]